jgi:putative ABC transport system substrate-binding protein
MKRRGRRALLLSTLALHPAARAVRGPALSSSAPARLVRLGALGIGASDVDGAWSAFLAELSRLGWVEGRDFTLLRRRAESHRPDHLPALAQELVAAQVDLIYAENGSPAAVAAAQATTTIPIVFFSSADPIGLGLVQSLPRPGGNVTGGMGLGYETASKGLELLAEAVQRLRQAVFFVPPTDRPLPGIAGLEPHLRATAERLGVRMLFDEPSSTEALIGRLPALRRERTDAAIVFDFPLYARDQARIAGACIAHRLPAYGYAQAGFLLQIMQDRAELARIAARQVDRILGGARPAELPVERLTVLQLVLNLRTARALGLRVPASVVARASEVIE